MTEGTTFMSCLSQGTNFSLFHSGAVYPDGMVVLPTRCLCERFDSKVPLRFSMRFQRGQLNNLADTEFLHWAAKSDWFNRGPVWWCTKEMSKLEGNGWTHHNITQYIQLDCLFEFLYSPFTLALFKKIKQWKYSNNSLLNQAVHIISRHYTFDIVRLLFVHVHFYYYIIQPLL